MALLNMDPVTIIRGHNGTRFPIFLAARNHQWQMVTKLAEYGANVNVTGHGQPLLFVLAGNEGNEKNVRKFVRDYGIDARDANGMTIAH